MTTLYHGGLVFDGKGILLEQHGVLVDAERISKVAPLGVFDNYSGKVVDTTGATLMPGLVDCHVHLCFTPSADPDATLSSQSAGEITMTALANAQTTLSNGVTAVRDCGGKDFLEFAVRDAINRGLFDGPTIYASGQMICMTGGHGSRWGRVADGCDNVITAVREQIHRGCDMVKIMATGGILTQGVEPEDSHYSAEEMLAGVAEAKRFRRRTASHAQGTEGILNAVRAGIDSIEHGIFLDDRCIEEMLKNGTYLVPTIAALKNILINSGAGIPAYVVEKVERMAEQHRRSFLAFYQAGGKIALGTDAGTPFNNHGKNSQELAHMVEFGMSEKDALIAGTFNGADLMGLKDTGNIVAGAVADLLIVEGNPLQDISLVADSSNHRMVLKAGKLVKD